MCYTKSKKKILQILHRQKNNNGTLILYYRLIVRYINQLVYQTIIDYNDKSMYSHSADAFIKL